MAPLLRADEKISYCHADIAIIASTQSRPGWCGRGFPDEHHSLWLLAIDCLVSCPRRAAAEGIAVRGNSDRHPVRRAVPAGLCGRERRARGADLHSRRPFDLPVAGDHRISRNTAAGAAADPFRCKGEGLRKIAGAGDGGRCASSGDAAGPQSPRHDVRRRCQGDRGVGQALDHRGACDLRAPAGAAPGRAVCAGRRAGPCGYLHRGAGGDRAVCQTRAERFSGGGEVGRALLQAAGVCDLASVRAAGVQGGATRRIELKPLPACGER